MVSESNRFLKNDMESNGNHPGSKLAFFGELSIEDFCAKTIHLTRTLDSSLHNG